MKDIENILLEHQPIEVDQQIKEIQIQSLMIEVSKTDFVCKSSFFKDIMIQIPFIDKKCILLQALLLLIGIWITFNSPSENIKTTLNIISSIGAFLAVIDMIETWKSHQYNMWEIEAACKNNLQELMMQRYLITGAISILIIVILSIAATINLNLGFVSTLLYFMIPFMFVCWGYLKLLKISNHRINEAVLLSVVLFVSVVIIVLVMNLKIYSINDFNMLGLVFIVILILYLKEMIVFVNELKEGFEWN